MLAGLGEYFVDDAIKGAQHVVLVQFDFQQGDPLAQGVGGCSHAFRVALCKVSFTALRLRLAKAGAPI